MRRTCGGTHGKFGNVGKLVAGVDFLLVEEVCFSTRVSLRNRLFFSQCGHSCELEPHEKEGVLFAWNKNVESNKKGTKHA